MSPQSLLLDVIALCWYPFAHEHTLLPALGMNPRDKDFLEGHKRHIVELVAALSRPHKSQPAPCSMETNSGTGTDLRSCVRSAEVQESTRVAQLLRGGVQGWSRHRGWHRGELVEVAAWSGHLTRQRSADGRRC